jgi:hypothetical protein
MPTADRHAEPEAHYQIAALRITCPWPGCPGVLTGPNGTALIVRQDSFRAGQVVVCPECGRPYRLPDIIDQLSA